MSTKKSDHEKLTLEELLRAESSVLDRIAGEIEGAPHGGMAKPNHLSGHTSGAHNSTVAPLEAIDGTPGKSDGDQ
jgi:hypothetical protein